MFEDQREMAAREGVVKEGGERVREEISEGRVMDLKSKREKEWRKSVSFVVA